MESVDSAISELPPEYSREFFELLRAEQNRLGEAAEVRAFALLDNSSVVLLHLFSVFEIIDNNYSKIHNYLYTIGGEVRKPRQRVGQSQILRCLHIFGLHYKSRKRSIDFSPDVALEKGAAGCFLLNFGPTVRTAPWSDTNCVNSFGFIIN